jgi:cytochrome c oxidase cbb3-type subunit 3
MTDVTQDRVRDHGFDDIQEFDNRLPNWWLWTFYGAVIFSFFYWFHYQVLGTGDLPGKELLREQEAYSQAMQERLAQEPVSDASLLKLAADPVTVKKGDETFKMQCAQCHRPDGGGIIGPNLTDGHWLHGNKPMDIYSTIMNGVPGKAMVPWKGTLGSGRVQQVTAWVLSVRNTNVQGGKAPEGDKREQ